MAACRREEGTFPSSNQRDQLYYFSMTPTNGHPRGVVLIHHGMSGRSASYEPLASFLCENGYAVYGYDCAGHGRSVADESLFGSFGDKDGDVVLVNDLGAAIALVRRRYRHLPLFLLGHSLGSFVMRTYAAAHGRRQDSDDPATLPLPEEAPIDGLILSGTCARIRPSRLERFRLARKAKKGDSKGAARVIFSKIEKEFAGEPGGWVTTAPRTGAPDPLSGHGLTAMSYYDMYRLMNYVSSDEWLKKMPGSLSILFLSGARDPVGGMGKGIVALCEALADADVSDVSYRLYEGEKHEILDVPAVAPKVWADLLGWLEEKTEAALLLRQG